MEVSAGPLMMAELRKIEGKYVMLSEISQRKTNTTWFHLYVESKKQNKQTKLKQTHTYKEQFDICHIGCCLERRVEKVKRLRSTNCQLSKWSLRCKIQHREYSQ